MKICVIGTGYVGLVAGTGFAEIGHFVSCVDRDPARIDMLLEGKMPIYEPGLEELVLRNTEEGRLTFTRDMREAVEKSLIIFLCVGTPSADDGSADLTAVFEAAREVASHMPGYRVIVSKSTCPVGTTDRIREIVAETTSHPFDVVSNPEFLREGSAIDDFMRPDRVVIGCDDVRVEELMKELYAPLLRTGNPFIAMDRPSAELAKYACNAMLAARISMMNELACLCESFGADITRVRDAVGSDARIGAQYLHPSLGFGGSCLPKDVSACAKLVRDAGLGDGILAGVLTANSRQQTRFAQRILDYYGGSVKGLRLAVWGVAFKARTDDIRSAPALAIIDTLLDAGAEIAIYDPVAGARVTEHYGDRVTVVPKCYDVLRDADGLVIPTEWREFQSPDYERMAELMKRKVIFDGRNLYPTRSMHQHGFDYLSVGRPDVRQPAG
jgi:UDPglucose 6-dehydrogenase